MTEYVKAGVGAWGPATALADEPLPVTLGQYAGYQEMAENDIGNNNAIVATRWVLEDRYGDVTFATLGAFTWGAAGNVRIGIYSDSGGAPSSLLAAAPEAAVANGRVESDLASPITLSPGAYWLAANFSSASAGIGTRGGYQQGIQSLFVSSTYGALPSSFPGGASGQDANRSIYALGSADALTKEPDPAAPAAPSPIPTGYSLVFRDEFHFLDRTKWTDMVWWDKPSEPNTQYVDLDTKTLHLVARQSDDWPNTLMDTLGSMDNLVFGYFEARMRSTGNRSDFPAWWLFSSDWAKRASCVAGDRAAELDVVELWGNDFPTVFSGTAHSDSAGQCTANQQSDGWHDRDPETMVGEWHTYGLLWEPTLLSWYIDNTLSHTLAVGAGTNWDELDSHPMHVILYQWPDRGFTIDGPFTLNVRNVASNLSGGADFNYKLLTTEAAAANEAISIAADTTETSFAWTDQGQSGVASAGAVSGEWQVRVNVVTANSNIHLSVQLHRVNSTGTIQSSSSASAEQQLSAAGRYWFRYTGLSLGTWGATDRLRVDFIFRNANAGSAESVTLEWNSGNFRTGTWVMAPFTGLWYMPTPGVDPAEIHTEIDWIRVWQVV